MAWREADEWERERGWIRLVGNEGSCHLFLSTHCVTPGCYMPLSPPRVWRWRSTPPLLLFFFFFLSERVLHLQLCALPFPPRHSHHSPSLLSFALPSFLFFPPPLLSLHLSACITFSPGYVEWTESRTMAAFQSHDPVLEVGGGGHWLLVFFFSLLSIQNRLMQLAYYWHVSPQN